MQSYITGDILGNLRVRISDPWEKKCPWKIFEISFWFETSKNDHSRGRGWGCKCPCLRVNVAFYFPKMPFYFQNCPFTPRIALLFSTIALFNFQNCSFILQKCPFASWDYHLFSRSALLFSSLAFSSSRSAFVFITVRVFFQECFFPQLIVTSPRPAQSCLKRWYLPCSCFVSSSNYLLTN